MTARWTPAEADGLRRSMATFKASGLVSQFKEKLTKGMLQNGYTLEYAHRVFKQLEGFGSYGFPESHAASFAQLVYVSSWIKCHYPDVFAAALLNSQPMGFYAPFEDPEARREFVRYYGFLRRYDTLYRANRPNSEVLLLFPRKIDHQLFDNS